MMSGIGGGENEAAAYIPPDLCEEILHRLPSNDLLNYKLVCKDWLRLISSTGFIQKHLKRSKAECNDLRIVVPFKSMTDILDCANNTSKKTVAWERPDILGSCDGLVLYYGKCDGTIAAFNPSTGESVMRIPNQSIKDDIEHDWLICSWFGHHPSSSTGEYVLVVANLVEFKEETAPDRIVFKVYSLSRLCNNMNIICSSSLEEDDMNSWMESCLSRHETIGTLLHGRLHVPAQFDYFEEIILVYDFETNEIVRMALPQESWCATLGVVDGYLCVLIKREEVWMMKEYGAEESWTKYADIDDYRYCINDGDILRPYAFCPNGDVMICVISDDNSSKVLGKYSLRKREINQILKAYTNHDIIKGTIIACIDSLVSPTLIALEGS